MTDSRREQSPRLRIASRGKNDDDNHDDDDDGNDVVVDDDGLCEMFAGCMPYTSCLRKKGVRFYCCGNFGKRRPIFIIFFHY